MKKASPTNFLFAISSEIPNASGVKAIVEPGRAHYSYRSVRDKFCEMLDETGAPWVDIKHPEIYRDFNLSESNFSNLEAEKVHISFKPTQYLRAAGGFKNIAHIAWEFDTLRSKYSSQPVLPANDDLRMLKAFDQVWVGCEFTRDTLIAHGITSTYTVPAPCKLPSQFMLSKQNEQYLSQIEKIKKLNIQCWPVSIRNHGFMYAQHSLKIAPTELTRALLKTKNAGGKAFLQILNPHDSRKNLKKLVKAFHALHHDDPDTILILKFTSPEKNEKVYEILRWFLDDSHALDATGVYFTTDYIPELLKYNFMSVFDYYVSPSRAEGQNLPLQEAMACGLVPISTVNTAMLDYVNSENAIVIESRETEITHLTTSDNSIWGFNWFDCTERDIYKSLISAKNASESEISQKRTLARQTIEENYSYDVVSKKMNVALTQ